MAQRFFNIQWPEACERQVHGRNGFSQCRGVCLDLVANDTEVMIQPINSKGEVTQCQIPIPVKDIPAVIRALQALRSASGQVHPLVSAIEDVRMQHYREGGDG